VLCVLIFLTFLVFRKVFSDVSRFDVLWVSTSVALFAEFILYLIFKRHISLPLTTKTKLLLILILPAIWFIATPLHISDMIVLEKRLTSIRAMEDAQISSITVTHLEKAKLTISDVSKIKDFVKLCQSARIFYPNHELTTQAFKIEFISGKKTQRYSAAVYANHSGDMVLVFKAYFTEGKIIIPDGVSFFKTVQ
jgi:hypothetical protein